MTLRELLDLTGAARGHWVLPGTPESVADTLERWFPERAADGFNILPAYFPAPSPPSWRRWCPSCNAAACSAAIARGTAFRGHLGLARPAWRQ